MTHQESSAHAQGTHSSTLSEPSSEMRTIEPRRIQKLSANVSDKIAAGEVVERPGAVIKELVENAIDAGASRIVVEVEQGGKKYIRVTDNGCGLNPEDVPLAFERHATSKVASIEDLVSLRTLGFRGEALSSIAAVSYLEMTTRRQRDEEGIHMALAGGRETHRKATSAAQGTTVVVKDLFFNTPARLKFMKSATSEAAYISDLMTKLALSHPERSFQYVLDKRLVFKTPGDGDPFAAAYATLERGLSKSLFEFAFGNDLVKVKGWASKIDYTRGNRNYQMTFVNGRYVKSRLTLDAIQYAYQGLLPSGRFPAVLLYLEIEPEACDVNIHPQKTEIKFEREDALRNYLSVELKRALEQRQQVPVRSFGARPVQGQGTSLTEASLGKEAIGSVGSGSETLTERPKSPMEIPYKGINIRQNDNLEQLSPEEQALPENIIDGSQKSPVFEKPEFTREKSTAYEKGLNHQSRQVGPVFDTTLLERLVLPETHPSAQDETMRPEVAEPTETLYDGARFVGQFFKSFLVFEKNDHLLLIDQHAAHEKILYARLKRDFERRAVVRQILVEPILIECDQATALRLSERTELLEKIGFALEPFGETDFILREVPMLFDVPGTKRFFDQLKDQENAHELRAAAARPIEDRMMSMACKAAVKANDDLTPFEAAQLIKELRTLESPYTCPHGRPLVVRMERSELEKKFLRT